MKGFSPFGNGDQILLYAISGWELYMQVLSIKVKADTRIIAPVNGLQQETNPSYFTDRSTCS